MRILYLLPLLALLLTSTPVPVHALGVVMHLPYAARVGGYRPVILVYVGTSDIQAFHVTIDPLVSVSCSKGGLRPPRLPSLELYVPVARIRLPSGVRLPVPPGARIYTGLLPGLPTLEARVYNESVECNVSLGYRVVVEPYPSVLALRDSFRVEGVAEKLPPLLLAYTSLEGYTVPAGGEARITILALSVAADPAPKLIVVSPSGVSRIEPRWDEGYHAVLESLGSWWRRVADEFNRSLGVEPPGFHTTVFVGYVAVSGAPGEYLLYYAEWGSACSNPGILYVYNPDAPHKVLVVDEGVDSYLLLEAHEWIERALNKSIASHIVSWLGVPQTLVKRLEAVEDALAALNTTGLVTRPAWEKLGVYARLWVVRPGVDACRVLEEVKPDVVVLGFNPLGEPLTSIKCPDGSSLLDAILDTLERVNGTLIVSMSSLNGYELGLCDLDTGVVSWRTYGSGLLEPSVADSLGLVGLAAAEEVKRRVASSLCARARLSLEEGRVEEAKRLERLSTLVASAPLALYTWCGGGGCVYNTGVVLRARFTLVGWQFEHPRRVNASRESIESASRIAAALLKAYMLAHGEGVDERLVELSSAAANYSLRVLIPRLLESISRARVDEAEGVIKIRAYGVTTALPLGGIAEKLSSWRLSVLEESRSGESAILCLASSRGYRVVLSSIPVGRVSTPAFWERLLEPRGCAASFAKLYGVTLPRDTARRLEEIAEFYASSGYRLASINSTILPANTTIDVRVGAHRLLLLVHPTGSISIRLAGNATLIADTRSYTLVGTNSPTTLMVSCRECNRLLNPLYLLAYEPLTSATAAATTTVTFSTVKTVTRTLEKTLRVTLTKTIRVTYTRTWTLYRVLTPRTRIVRVTVTAPPRTVVVTSYSTLTETSVSTVTRLVGRGLAAVAGVAGLVAGVAIGYLAARLRRLG